MNYKGKDDYIKYLKKKNNLLQLDNQKWIKRYEKLWRQVQKAKELLKTTPE